MFIVDTWDYRLGLHFDETCLDIPVGSLLTDHFAQVIAVPLDGVHVEQVEGFGINVWPASLKHPSMGTSRVGERRDMQPLSTLKRTLSGPTNKSTGLIERHLRCTHEASAGGMKLVQPGT